MELPAADLVDASLLGEFSIKGSPTSVLPLKRGHINDTYVSTWSTGARYIHQRVNSKIFRDVPALMRNVAAVLAHWRLKAKSDRSGLGLRPLEIVPTTTGGEFLLTSAGEYWRSYRFVEGTRAVDFCRSAAEAREAARAFSKFQEYLLDFDASQLTEVIPGFHDTTARLEQLRVAAEQDPCGRAVVARQLTSQILSRADRARAVVQGLRTGVIPLRVTHNDLKINNVLFDEEGTQAVTVVDLDTCMPGSLLYDWGPDAVYGSPLRRG